jgi:hypothetical protein
MWVARLPHQVGYPAGGSLGADEWKGLAMVYCPVVVCVSCLDPFNLTHFPAQIPMVWDEWYPIAMADHLKKTENWDKNEQARLRRVAKGKQKANGKDNQPSSKPGERRMDVNDADVFLKLSAALKILMARSINTTDLPRAKELLQGYLLGFLQVHFAFYMPSFLPTFFMADPQPTYKAQFSLGHTYL